jgi:hypothetical protein
MRDQSSKLKAQQLNRHSKVCSRVTSSAIVEAKITTKGSPPIVAGATGHAATGRKVLGGRGRAHLP